MSEQKAENRSRTSTLPVLAGPVTPRETVSRYSLPASFASQLIAARDRMEVQRARRTAPPEIASDAYRRGGRIAVKRMPKGYVRTLLV